MINPNNGVKFDPHHKKWFENREGALRTLKETMTCYDVTVEEEIQFWVSNFFLHAILNLRGKYQY